MLDFYKKFVYQKRARKVADFYDRWSDKFLTITDTFQGFRTENINDIHEYTIHAAGLADGDVILDAGCGVGGPAFYFAGKLKADIHALTNSSGQINIIEKRKAENRLSNLTAHLGDYHKLSEFFEPEYFSKVLFLESLGHSYHPERVLKEAHRALKTGGSIYIRDLYIRQEAMPETAREIRRLIEQANDTFVYNHTTDDDMAQLLDKIGFTVEFRRMPDVIPKSIDHEFEKKLGIAPPKGIQFAVPVEMRAVKK